MKQSGFTLIEMLVGLGIGLFGILLFSSALVHSENSIHGIHISATRSDLASSVRRAISDRKALKKTIENNPALKAAVTADYSGSVNSLLSGAPYGIRIYTSSGVALTNPEGGPNSAQDVYYTSEGMPCAQFNVGNCLFSIQSYFLIQGWPEWGTYHNILPIKKYPDGGLAEQPEFIVIGFTVSYSNTSKSTIDLKEIRGTVFLSMDDIANWDAP